jgi:hypothetical protein
VTRGDEPPRRQVNVPLQGRPVLVLQLLLAREQCSVPELLGPVIEDYLEQQLNLDPDLADAIRALVASRSRARAAQGRVVHHIPPARRNT